MDTRSGLDPITRAVSDALDDLLWRHFELSSSWSHPETLIAYLDERGYQITPKGRAS